MKPHSRALAKTLLRFARVIVTWLEASVRISAFVGLTACCGGAPTHQCHFTEQKKPPEDAAQPDLSFDLVIDRATDLSTDMVDARPRPQTTCGREICVVGVTTCCLTASPFTLACIPADSKCPGTALGCDGPEDCSGGACCMRSDGSTTCQGSCENATTSTCHDASSCPKDKPICGPSSTVPSLRLCMASADGTA